MEGEAWEVKFDEKSFNPTRYRKFLEAYTGFNLTYRAFNSMDNKHSMMTLEIPAIPPDPAQAPSLRRRPCHCQGNIQWDDHPMHNSTLKSFGI